VHAEWQLAGFRELIRKGRSRPLGHGSRAHLGGVDRPDCIIGYGDR
jgi:hypothetical protein